MTLLTLGVAIGAFAMLLACRPRRVTPVTSVRVDEDREDPTVRAVSATGRGSDDMMPGRRFVIGVNGETVPMVVVHVQVTFAGHKREWEALDVASYERRYRIAG